MSNNFQITGNVGSADLRFTPQGKAVFTVSVADTPRRKNEQSGEWEDAGETLWVRASLWEAKAEAAAEMIQKGMKVTVVGRLEQRYYEKDGQQRSALEVKYPEVSVVPKSASANGGGQQQSGGFGGPAQSDPWASGGNTGGQQSGGWDSQGTTEPPF